MINEGDLWILSFYRLSEISGALFFGRLARTIATGSIQRHMTKHFADESQHAWYWTDCIAQLGASPLKLNHSYQDQYLEEAGLPVNLMEVLAITQVFERRVINQYARHQRASGVPIEIRATLARIMEDERWHIKWVRDALRSMEPEFGRPAIEDTLKRFTAADGRVYQRTMAEHADRIRHLLGTNRDEEPEDEP